MAALKLRIKVERDSLRMCHRASFAKVTRRGCSALGQFSGTEGETKPVGLLDSESQLLGSLRTTSPQRVEESQPSASPQLLTLEPSSQTTGHTKVLKSSYKQSPS